MRRFYETANGHMSLNPKTAFLIALLSTATLCTSGLARTPHWQKLLVQSDGRTIFVDTDKISRQRKLVITWILTNYNGPQRAAHGKAFRSKVEKTLNDCESKRIATSGSLNMRCWTALAISWAIMKATREPKTGYRLYPALLETASWTSPATMLPRWRPDDNRPGGRTDDSLRPAADGAPRRERRRQSIQQGLLGKNVHSRSGEHCIHRTGPRHRALGPPSRHPMACSSA